MDEILIYTGTSLLAVCTGILTGIFGVGGGFLMVPALIILLGIDSHIAVGTSMAVILITSSFGVFKRRGTGTVDTRLGLTIACGAIAGVTVGIWLLEKLKSTSEIVVFSRTYPAVQFAVLTAFLVLLSCLTVFILWDYRKNANERDKDRPGLLARLSLPPYIHCRSLNEPKLSLITVLITGVLIGVMTGFLGIGGGVVMLPLLIWFIGQKPAAAAGTSLLVVWICTIIGVAQHAGNHNIDYHLWAAMLLGGIIGTHFGTTIGLKLSGKKIRLYFAYILIVAIAMICYQLLR